MSDIKYIMAADNGEHTRFPCLAVVRSAAATVVTVLALAVIALVIHAVLRSEDIRLSVNDGYIGADTLWSQVTDDQTTTAMVDRPLGVRAGSPSDTSSEAQAQVADQTSHADAAVAPHQSDQPSMEMSGTDPTLTVSPANVTNLRVILIANNPSGRTQIDCNDTTVSLIKDQSWVIGRLDLGNFIVPAQTTITLQKRLKINDSATLTKIWKYYGGDLGFSVNVQVSAKVTSYPLGKKTTRQHTYVCPQVTIGLTAYQKYLVAADNAECWG